MAANMQTMLSSVKILDTVCLGKPTLKQKMTCIFLTQKGCLRLGLLQARQLQVFLLCQAPNPAFAWLWHRVHQEGDALAFLGKDEWCGNKLC